MVSDVVLSLEEAVVAQGEEATVSDMTHAQSRTNAMCGSYYRNFITVELEPVILNESCRLFG